MYSKLAFSVADAVAMFAMAAAPVVYYRSRLAHARMVAAGDLRYRLLFEKHPHFTIFPGECIEIMPVLPIPGA